MASLCIRSEIFEHSMYPSQSKFTTKNLTDLFKSLHLLSTFDYKINGSAWIEQSCKYVHGFSVTEAEFYFRTYILLARPIELFNEYRETEEFKGELKIEDLDVDVRCFAIFMATQLSAHRKPDDVGQGDWAQEMKPSKNSISSPRSKVTRS